MDQRQNPDIRTGGGVATQRLELSVPQVAGSALAAIAAAVFASKLGVYGTIIGAGVVSVIATCGGTVFQHLFRRTGDQIREVSVQVKPKARQVYDSEPAPAPTPAPAGRSPQEAAARDEFGGATTYGTRVRGWKRPVVAAAVVFAVAMLGITGYELAAGQDLSGGKGTTFSSVVRGGDSGGDSAPDGPAGPRDGGPTPSGDGTETDKDKGTGTVESPTPTPSAPGTGQSPNPNPDPPESGGPSTAPTPEPSRPDGGSGDSSGEGVSPPTHESTVPSP
ncbi:hypothetical protein [Streptomyces sp. IB2014 016-6]|uniref:hypothetical protein n=1 Tax=Streptomyces sp. IB2014 016-6 TaxID=2517818 RepID=UPI0011C86870|nr:hypothetical protein [Streptomyces sp. IB2014 016-6]TXL84270.1 hypothetical protein EW053_34875 [Streptomyces sp. IB2014 016-6]